MSIQPINPGLANPAFIPGLGRPRGAEEAAPQTVQRPDAQAAAARAVAGPTRAVPTEAPGGTDPALWSVLTSEERSFFARARSMGPLTYGPGSAADAAPGVRLGGRIDVKV
jgi:hypothetical protein